MAVLTRALLALALTAAMLVAPLQAPAAQALSTVRYAGADRFATSVEVSKWSDGWAGSTVFLASGLKFPDALAAGPVAAAERAHLLLTRPEQVDATVMQRIVDLAPSEIVIVGSEASVSAAVAEQVRSATGAIITRIGGRDRVETSLLLLDRLLAQPDVIVDTVWVASGHNFPDALVAASVAGTRRHAVILDYHDGTADGVEAWRQRVEPYVQGRVVNIAGGGPSVSPYDEQVLRWSGTTGVFRYSGADRYETARVINDTFNPGPSDRSMMLATGENFPDALSGAVHAALRGIPLYLTPKACHARISDMLRQEAYERGIQTVVGLGTSASISDLALQMGPCEVTASELAGTRWSGVDAAGNSIQLQLQSDGTVLLYDWNGEYWDDPGDTWRVSNGTITIRVDNIMDVGSLTYSGSARLGTMDLIGVDGWGDGGYDITLRQF